MKRIYTIISLLATLSFTACDLEDPNSLSPDEVFVKYYGGAGTDAAADMVVNLNGNDVDGFVIFGTSNSYQLTQQITNQEWVLIFTDKGGTTLPDGIKSFPVADILPPTADAALLVTCEASRIKKASDGGYLLIGTIKYTTDLLATGLAVEQTDMLVIKVDDNGDFNPGTDAKVLGAYRTVLNSSTVPASYDTLIFDQTGKDIVEIADGYFCLGSTFDVGTPGPGNPKDFYFVKLNAALDTVWTRSLGTTADDEGNALLSISSGTEVIVGGATKLSLGGSSSVANFNGAYATIPVSGSVVPESISFATPGSTSFDEKIERLYKLSDADIFMTGNSSAVTGSATRPFLLRVTGGSLQSNTRIDVPDGVEVSDFYRTLGGRFVYAATTSATDGSNAGAQLLLMKTDDFGQGVADFTDATSGTNYNGYRYGGSGDEKAAAVRQLPDGSYVMLGTIAADNNSQTLIGLIKVNSNGILGY